MTLKNKEEFTGESYTWTPLTPFGGCNAINDAVVSELLMVEPFSDRDSNESIALCNFKREVESRLWQIMMTPSGDPRTFTEHQVSTMYEAQVIRLVNTLKTQELKNKVHSVLMAACGFIVGLLALAPLGIPLCFSSVRQYVGSFFKAPTVSADLFQSKMQSAVAQLKALVRNEIQCFMSDSMNEEDCEKVYSFTTNVANG